MAKILIVDDDPQMRDLMASMLAETDLEVVVSGSPREALAAQAETGPFDIAILDIWLGLESGLDLCDALRETAPNLPVVFVSGGGGSMSMEITTALADLKGQNAFLYKPFKKGDFLKTVHSIL